ncbi:synaptosomal-associated protein 29 [Contarinia nasturtii]|uniref:synaptosomal-associated protein 29 n=1 Tax=Contarinia nasturtii TaxID=265458 RepID=UPI0012D42752|nr:synaptosomal-associated protein 29 [Contarinia nasturtii]
MSGYRYTANSANLFDDDDIDDETFLKNSSRARQDQPFSYQEKTRAIEERTLASSNRSLGLLYETEKVGVATAEELTRQREQLENTNKHLDDINQTLRFSQKHLNGLKSIFGGLKNYIAGQRDEQPLSQVAPTPTVDKRNVQSFSQLHGTNMQSESILHQSQSTITGTGGNFNKQLDKNLDEMAGSLSRLKGLAIDLNQEIDDQNDLIENITTKVENVDAKLGRQNKEINRLLGKK